MKRTTGLAPFSSKRLESFREAGIFPQSTFGRSAPIQRKRESKPRRRVRYTGPSRLTVASLEIRCGGYCEYPGCGRRAQDPHHRDERGQGGRGVKAPAWINLLANLLAACRQHNAWASNDSPTEAKAMGWLIEMGQATPYTVPVLTRHHPLKVYLDDAGGYRVARPATNTSSEGATNA